MIKFSQTFPKYKYLTGLIKLYKALYKYHDHLVLSKPSKADLGIFSLVGDSNTIDNMRNIHIDDKILIVANGPSLKDVDWKKYEGHIKIICNGFYKRAEELGIDYNYYVIEDREQAEIRANDINKLDNCVKLCAVSNAYVLNRGWTYFNVPYRRSMTNYFSEDLYPQFSRDFASVVHLGSSVIYIMLQLAFHLGSKHVDIVGLDHDYGELPKLFSPGKLLITEKNIDLVRKCHFDQSYYNVGDVIGVPFVERQDVAFSYANEVFNRFNREIVNRTINSKCKAFKCTE